MRDRILDGLLDCAIWVVVALRWAAIGAIAVPFVWGLALMMRGLLGLVF